MEKLPKDIYRQTMAVAGAYYAMLARRRELRAAVFYEGAGTVGMPRRPGIADPTARKAERLSIASRDDWKIQCVEQALNRLEDDTEREFVRLNIFERIRMHHINLPMSIRTMKRTRGRYINLLAQELGEI